MDEIGKGYLLISLSEILLDHSYSFGQYQLQFLLFEKVFFMDCHLILFYELQWILSLVSISEIEK